MLSFKFICFGLFISFGFSVFYFVIYSIFISVLVLVILERQQMYFISVSMGNGNYSFYLIWSCIYLQYSFQFYEQYLQ